MKNNIYDKFNDIKIKYEEVPLNDLEKQKLKETIKNIKLQNKNKSFKKFIVTAVATFIFLFTLANSNSGELVLAKTKEIVNTIEVSIKDAMGMSDEVEKYSVKLSRPFEIEDKQYILNDILIDNKDLYVVIASLNNNTENNSRIEVDLSEFKVNGKTNKILGSSGTQYTLPGDKSINVLSLKHRLKDAIKNDGTAELEFIFSEYFDSNKKVSLIVQLDTEKIKLPKKLVLQNFNIPNTNSIIIDKFIISPVAQKITLKFPKPESNYIYSIKATDSQNKLIYFETLDSDKNGANLYFSPVISEISANEMLNKTKKIKCQLYRRKFPEESGKINTTEEKIGDEFIINIR